MAKLEKSAISTHLEGDVAVISIQGRLTIGSRAETDFRGEIRSLLASGVRRFVIDFNQVNRIDSSVIGELVAAHRLIEQQGGEVSLRNLSSRIRDVLRIT